MNEYLDIATEAAREAGALQRRAFRTGHRVAYKSPDDIVTDVDTRAEAVITERITDSFPNHAILAEESGERGTSPYRWIVDPLDGTTNFAQGIGHFCVSIALEIDGSLELGVVYHTPEDDLYTGVRNEGAFCNGETISVSNVDRFDQAIVGIEYSPRDVERNDVLEMLTELTVRARRTRHLGSSASELAMLSRSAFDGVYGTRFHPWDVAAGIVLVEEAGGTVTQLRGTGYGGSYAVSNGYVHDDLLKCLETA
ncbi:inositol monophosphatase family protein [Natronococcus wangiae]|uniref:inositol monophosphatase family protein n=1 Tax=Natronococcus wangiae TaxID=3068275 RepID=UPI00273F0D56|nr:inositol monophosphatase family protein [Natronococcus sp. AD5]